MMCPTFNHSTAALILSHPGHELRVLGWLKEVKPLVIILTDGSGHTDQPRIALSRKLIEEAGGRLASLCGNYSDQQFYTAILQGDLAFFEQLREEIAETLTAQQIEIVAGDSVEGYNPSHDLCRCLIDAALTELQATTGHTLQNYEFPLVELPTTWSEQDGAWCQRLNAAEQAWKLEQIQQYARQVGGTLLAEVDEMLSRFGEGILGEEWFSPSASGLNLSEFEQTPPFYERHGAQQVAAGYYQQAIQFRQHMLPLISALGRERRT